MPFPNHGFQLYANLTATKPIRAGVKHIIVWLDLNTAFERHMPLLSKDSHYVDV
jgi:hypothetical protein